MFSRLELQKVAHLHMFWKGELFAQDELYELHELAHLALDELEELHDPHILPMLEL